MVSHPCIRRDVGRHKAVHIRPEHPPYRLQILRFLSAGCSSRCFCEAEVCFFIALPIASFPTGVSSTNFPCSSSSRSVQRNRPSGAGEHATSRMRASPRPSNFRRALSEFTLRFKLSTPSIPSFTYCTAIFCTVDIQVQFVFAIFHVPHLNPAISDIFLEVFYMSLFSSSSF